MALISCPECRREISDQALSCPGCGYPIKAKSEQTSFPTGTAVKTAGGVFAAWLTAPWIARLVVGVVGLIALFTFLIVGIVMRQ
jgi:uncharacterized membrane protein YvbJ